MNPSYIAASITHTVPERLTTYLISPLTNLLVIFALVIMFVNVYMFRKLWKMKKRDYMLVANVTVICIYVVFSIITAVLVSRLSPHGTLTKDDCDSVYMFIPRMLFLITAGINVIYFIANIYTKFKKDKEYEKTVQRGYYAEETREEKQPKEEKHFELSSVTENIKEKIDVEKIKEKVNNLTENVKEIINNKINKE